MKFVDFLYWNRSLSVAIYLENWIKIIRYVVALPITCEKRYVYKGLRHVQGAHLGNNLRQKGTCCRLVRNAIF